MKRTAMFLFTGLFTLAVIATEVPVSNNVGDPHELDTKYESPFNVNLNEWFATHPLPAGQTTPRMDVVFQTPRVLVLSLSIKGSFPLHFHTSSDEILIPIKGKCREYVDGKWTWMQPGDVHYNPRGVIHGVQCDEGMEFQSFDIFTPAPPAGGDRVFLDSEKSHAKPGDVVGDWALVDTQFKSGAIINADDWYAGHPIAAGQTMRVDLPMGTPRGQMVLAQKPALQAHYHGSSDEIIYVYKGVGEELIKGQWVKLKAGEIHFCPRGFIHAIRPVSDDFKIFSFFTPPQANGNDRIFVKLDAGSSAAAEKPATATPAPAK